MQSEPFTSDAVERGQADFTPEFVQSLLETAGRTHMAMPSHGCRPAGLKSGMPPVTPKGLAAEFGADYLIWGDPPPKKIRRPTMEEIATMDRAYLWLGLLPHRTELHGPLSAQDRYNNDNRRLVFARSLINPRTDSHLYSWKRLAVMVHTSDKTAKDRWQSSINLIASRLNQPGIELLLARPGYCLAAGGTVGVRPDWAKPDPVPWSRKPARVRVDPDLALV